MISQTELLTKVCLLTVVLARTATNPLQQGHLRVLWLHNLLNSLWIRTEYLNGIWTKCLYASMDAYKICGWMLIQYSFCTIYKWLCTRLLVFALLTHYSYSSLVLNHWYERMINNRFKPRFPSQLITEKWGMHPHGVFSACTRDKRICIHMCCLTL